MKLPVDEIEIVDPSADIDQEQLLGIRDSIKEIGLSHNLIVRPAKDSGKYPLVTGEKRLLAVKLLGWSEVDVEIREVSEQAGKVIRLQENLKRFNLPWWEQVVLVEQLHNLRQAEFGVATRGRPIKGVEPTGWSIADTARELNVGMGPLSEDLGLARAIRTDPLLAKVKDKKTAIRLMRIAVDRYKTQEVAELPSATANSLGNQVFFGDAELILKQLPNGSVDHCVTDPPWIKFFEPSLRMDERTLPVFRELYRVLKHGSMLYLFVGLQDWMYYAGNEFPDPANPVNTIHTRGALENLGFNVSNTPVLWQKVSSLSRRGVRPWEYARDFEFIVIAAKGSPTLVSSAQLSAIKSFKIVHPSSMIHPNEKPVDLMADIITDCSYEKNIIIDPFGGSGVVGEACKKTKRNYVIIERDKKFYDGIVKRLENK